MKKLIFALPGNEKLAKMISDKNGVAMGLAEFGMFPDQEYKQRVYSPVTGTEAIVVCTLNDPNAKLIRLHFFCRLLRSLGALKITLIAPYLPYMRQDKAFNEGEGITAKYMAALIDTMADELITIDPHLHRIKHMSEVFSITTKVYHAHDHIAQYIKKNIPNAVLIGPDIESSQWVERVAVKSDVPFTILEKVRYGDRQVSVSHVNTEWLLNRTPVLVDDIISTGRTMIETVKYINEISSTKPICIAIHAIFAENSYEELSFAGVQKIISCNTIPHRSNGIDITELFSGL